MKLKPKVNNIKLKLNDKNKNLKRKCRKQNDGVNSLKMLLYLAWFNLVQDNQVFTFVLSTLVSKEGSTTVKRVNWQRFSQGHRTKDGGVMDVPSWKMKLDDLRSVYCFL